jgi:hypothetical protein
MDELQVHIGETGTAVVTLRDKDGNVTGNYDETGGIVWRCTDPAAASIVDEDVNPFDARFQFSALSAEPFYFECEFDGRRGEEENRVTVRSQPIRVVAGEAVAGEIQVQMDTVAVV